jgi:bifunctional non-homologous end joining protein LigD
MLPDETLVDGEVVALDGAGRPSFNALQNFTSPATSIVYYVFDVLVLGGRDVMSEPLAKRRALLSDHVLPKLPEPVRESLVLEASLADLVSAIRSRLGGPRRKTTRQPVRTWPALRRMAENADEPRAGVRDRRIHAWSQELRRADLRILRG